MENKLLPLGSVVLLKGGEKKLFIGGYGISNEDKKVFDYIGYPYPEGFMTPKVNFLFDNDSIDKVLFNGYKDEEFDEVEKNIIEYINKNRG